MEFRSFAIQGGAAQRASIWISLLLWSMTSGCYSITYEPKVTIGMVSEPIPLRVKVRDLEDVSPQDDRRRWLLGTAATAPDALDGELSREVTNALIANFRTEGMFAEVRRKPKTFDLLLSGTLRRFYGKANLNTLGVLTSIYSPLWLLGIPIYTSYGTVDLELTFDRPDGSRVASYAASVEFSELSSFWGNAEVEIGDRLNRSFSEAVRDLRQKMMQDKEVLLAAKGASESPIEAPQVSESPGDEATDTRSSTGNVVPLPAKAKAGSAVDRRPAQD